MININNPCPIKWESMNPLVGGNYCDSCCKVVVDFSECSNEEIVNYFSVNAGKKVCGRFLKEQVISPKYKNRVRKFAAAAIFVFGGFLFTSCGSKEPEHVVGDVAYVPDSAHIAQMKVDSTNMANNAKRVQDSIAKLGK